VFPAAGFDHTIDALAAGLPVIARTGPLARSRRTAALLREMNLPELIAHDADSFIAVAVRLGADAALRQNRSAKVRAAMQP
jgi:predicted O-linked N-acetylglucosamine transferase (SPINDLY family)